MADRPLRCLVTGATGFLGRNILASLQSRPDILPGSSPFLTRSIVYLAEDWLCSTSYATRKLGFVPRKDWRIAIRESLPDLKGYSHVAPAGAGHMSDRGRK